MKITLPLRTVNITNRREHWAKRSRRAKEQRMVARIACRPVITRSGAAIVVTLTRIAPRALDAHDGLRAALKSVVDGVADAMGIDDRDKSVEWRYAQKRGAPREYAVIVEIEEAKTCQ